MSERVAILDVKSISNNKLGAVSSGERDTFKRFQTCYSKARIYKERSPLCSVLIYHIQTIINIIFQMKSKFPSHAFVKFCFLSLIIHFGCWTGNKGHNLSPNQNKANENQQNMFVLIQYYT